MHLPDQNLRRFCGRDFWPPLALKRTESLRGAFRFPSSATLPRGRNRWRKGASGSSTALAGCQPRHVEGCVTVLDTDGRGVAVAFHARGDATSPRPRAHGRFELFVAGGDPVLVGHDPHLHEVHGLVVAVTGDPPAVVFLRVQDTGAGRSCAAPDRDR